MHPKVSSHLTREGVSFAERRHADVSIPIKGPNDFAKALGYPIERITKSLYLGSGNGARTIAVCSINKKIRLNVISADLGCARLEVVGKEELARVIGYPPTGVSPFGVGCPI